MSGSALRTIATLAWLASFAVSVTSTPVAAQEDDPPDPGPVPGAVGQPAAPLDDKRLYDMANLLSNTQEAKIEADAARLAGHGIPSVVIAQASDMTPEDAATFAAEIRTAWGVESSTGAEDGLVIVVVVRPSEEFEAFAVTSWGDRALPHYGVDQSTADRIETDWLNAPIDSGDVFAGIDHSLRRLIYHSIYEPAPPQPLSSTQATARDVVGFVAPLLAIGAVAFTVARHRHSRSRRGDWLAWALPSLTAVVATLSVWWQSELATLSTLVLLVVIAARWVLRDPVARREAARA